MDIKRVNISGLSLLGAIIALNAILVLKFVIFTNSLLCLYAYGLDKILTYISMEPICKI